MAGKTELEAVQNYIEPLQKAVSCVTDAVLSVSGGYYASDKPHALTFGDGLPQKLPQTNLYIAITQLYYVVRDDDPDRGPWKATIAEYVYTLRRGAGERKPEVLLSYQWHPRPRAKFNYPHLHLGSASGVEQHLGATHIPTGRVALEDVLRFSISQLGVKPRRDDWKEVLDKTQGRFEAYRTWGGSGSIRDDT